MHFSTSHILFSFNFWHVFSAHLSGHNYRGSESSSSWKHCKQPLTHCYKHDPILLKRDCSFLSKLAIACQTISREMETRLRCRLPFLSHRKSQLLIYDIAPSSSHHICPRKRFWDNYVLFLIFEKGL